MIHSQVKGGDRIGIAPLFTRKNNYLLNAHEALTLIPEAIIKTGWVLMTGSFNPPVHLGLFLNDAAAVTYWGTFLSGVDLFGLWFLYLLGLGIAQIGRGSYTITWSAIGFIWCLWIIISKAVESLGSIYV